MKIQIITATPITTRLHARCLKGVDLWLDARCQKGIGAE
jgi:hypothetical protein